MSANSPPPKIACPHCQGLIKSPALPPGSPVNCPKCGQAFRIGQTAEAQQEPRLRGQRGEVGGQKAGGRRSEVGDQPAGARGQGPGDVQRSAIRSQASSAPPPAAATPAAAKPASPRPGAIDPDVIARSLEHSGRTGVAAVHKEDLVDPNLLAPAPPPKKAKPTQVVVVCKLCGTRLHAPLEKVGQTIQCPDCHRVNEILPPREPTSQKPKGPSLENAEEFDLSAEVQRPAYRPLQKPRGDYAVLSAFEPGAAPPGWTPPDSKPSPAGAPGSSQQPSRGGPSATAAPTAVAMPAEDEEEFAIEAPVERIELAPPPIKLPTPEPEEKLFDGRYDDDLIGANVDRKAPGAWKRAPFTVGIVEFLFQPGVLLRWILYGIGAAAVIGLMHFTGAKEAAAASDADILMSRFLLLVTMMVFGVSFVLWVAPFAVCCLAIVEDTANGDDEITSWPDYNFLDWFLKATFVPAAALVSGFPGIVLGSFIVVSGAAPAIYVWLTILASWVFLFPLVLCSMLDENSILSPYSKNTYRSLKAASDAWMLFYVFVIVLGVLGALAFALAAYPFTSPIGAIAMVVLAFLFFRLLGRMMWIGHDKLAKLPAEEE